MPLEPAALRAGRPGAAEEDSGALAVVERDAGDREVPRDLDESEPVVQVERRPVALVREVPDLVGMPPGPVESRLGQRGGDAAAAPPRVDDDAGEVPPRRRLRRPVAVGIDALQAAV